MLAFFSFSFSIQLHAQECHGFYGTPESITTFGSLTGDSLPPGRTRYTYTSSPCPTEGHYTIIDSISGCFGNTWHHESPDADGNMMLVNASVDPGDVFVDTIKNLCGSTNYSFGVWTENVSMPSSCGGPSIRPRLSFRVESLTGETLAFYNGSDLEEIRPTFYSLIFRTGAGFNSVIVRISDMAPGGCGNVFSLDDVVISPCGPDVEGTVLDILGSSLGASVDLCIGDASSARLFAKVGDGYYNPSYQWQKYNGTDWVDIPGAESLYYQPTDIKGVGTYKYRLTVAEEGNIGSSRCRVASNEITMKIRNPMTGAAASNSPVCENSIIKLSASGGLGYQWSGPSGFTSMDANPGFTATRSSGGQYTVIIIDSIHCRSIDTITVVLIPPPIITVSSTQSICQGDSVTLSASGGNTYSWLPVNDLSGAFSKTPIVKPNGTTRYTVTVTDSNNCTDTAGVLIVIHTKPVVYAGNDKVIIKGGATILGGKIDDPTNVNFSWVPSPSLNDIHLLNPVADPDANTDYVLNASSAIGCGISSDTVSVKVYGAFYIPNAFTPNGDGLNDSWHIPALQAFPDAVLSVYNRYGNKIFESTAGNRDWDGNYKNKAQPSGAYPYVIDLKNNQPVLKGVVMIVR